MSSNKWQVVMLYELLHAAYAVLPKYFEPVVAAWLLVCNRLMGTHTTLPLTTPTGQMLPIAIPSLKFWLK